MANISGAVRTDNLTNLFEDLSKTIKLIGWKDARLLSRIRKVEDATQLKHEWDEDEYLPTSTTLAVDRQTISLLCTLTHSYRIRLYEIVRIGSSICRVTGIGSGATLTITSVGGETLVTAVHDALTPVIGLQVGQIEGADPQAGIQTVPSGKYNYVEQFEDKLEMSDVRKAALGPGSPEKKRQWRKKIKEHAQRMENAVLYGYKQAPTSSAPALLGGLWDWITTNLKKVASDTACSTTTALTEVIFEEYMGKAYEAGGRPNLIVCNVVGMQALNTWYRSYYAIEKTKGPIGIHTTRIVTSFGDLEILLDPLVKNPTTNALYADMIKTKGVILGLDMSRIGKSFLREEGSTRRVPLARTGSSSNDMLRTMMTLEMKDEAAHFIIRNFALGG